MASISSDEPLSAYWRIRPPPCCLHTSGQAQGRRCRRGQQGEGEGGGRFAISAREHGKIAPPSCRFSLRLRALPMFAPPPHIRSASAQILLDEGLDFLPRWNVDAYDEFGFMSSFGLPFIAATTSPAQVSNYVAGNEAAFLSIGKQRTQAPARSFDHSGGCASHSQFVLEVPSTRKDRRPGHSRLTCTAAAGLILQPVMRAGTSFPSVPIWTVSDTVKPLAASRGSSAYERAARRYPQLHARKVCLCEGAADRLFAQDWSRDDHGTRRGWQHPNQKVVGLEAWGAD